MKITIVVEKEVKYVEDTIAVLESVKRFVQDVNEICDEYNIDLNDYLIEEKIRKEEKQA